MKHHILGLIAGTTGILVFGGNLIPNSSFELGTAGWGIRNEVPKIDGRYTALREQFNCDSKVHGACALELRNTEGQQIQLCSPGIPVKPGEFYTFSVWLKASEAMPVELFFFSPIDNNWAVANRKVTVSKEWKRYEFNHKVSEGHPEVVVGMQFQDKGTLFVDAVQLELGNMATEYTPSAPVEAAVSMPKTWVAAGEREVELRAVNYGENPERIPFTLTARNQSSGWKTEATATLELPVGKAVEKRVRMPLVNRGSVELAGEWKGGAVFPFRLAVMNALPSGKYDLEQGFCVGVNETGVFRNVAGIDDNPYQALGVDFSEHLEMLHATGVSLLRLFEYELARSWRVNPERGKFDFEHLNRYLDAVVKSELIPYVCIDTEGFEYNPTSTDLRNAKLRNWFFVRDGKKEEPWPHMKNIPVSPRMEDWNAYVGAYVKNGMGRVKYYEIMNEPNLRMTSAKYTAYLEQAFRTAKKVDPMCKIIGICATEDFGADGGGFTAETAKDGAFQYLDALSFHAYQASLDSAEVPAVWLLDKLNDLRRKYRPDMPLWNSELFYIHSRCDAREHRRKDPLFLRPENLARRYLIDLGEGLQVSTPLHVWQLFERNLVRMNRMEADPTRFGQKAVPNESAVAQNAFAFFLRGAKTLGRLNLPEGLNGYHYRDVQGREIAAVWALENTRKFLLSVPKGTQTFDLFGNPVDCTSKYLLEERPVYLVGNDLKAVLGKTIFQPREEIIVTGARFREPGVLAVEFQNRTGEPVLLTARIKDEKEIQRFTVPANTNGSVHFRTAKTTPALLWFSSGTQQESILNPIASRKTIQSGETVNVENSFEFTVETDQKNLSVSVSVKDRKRGERVQDQPWTGDCVELFLDAKPESGLDNPLLGAEVYRLFLFPASSNGLPAGLTGSPNIDLRKIKWSLHEGEAGYSGRIEIPWEAIGCKTPIELGFDIIADDAEGTKRIAYHAWAGDERNYSSRFQFGRLLKENGQDRK